MEKFLKYLCFKEPLVTVWFPKDIEDSSKGFDPIYVIPMGSPYWKNGEYYFEGVYNNERLLFYWHEGAEDWYYSPLNK